MLITREWAMPSPDTLTVHPIACFVARHLRGVSIDPFARNCRVATHTNDLDPATLADDHMDAVAWMLALEQRGVVADTMIFDPPYSPGQIVAVYNSIGLATTGETGQNGALYANVRNVALRVLAPSATVLSFGWNSAGMGINRGFEIEEILLVCHGGAHNDTICIAERRVQPLLL